MSTMKCNVTFINANLLRICIPSVTVEESVRYMNEFKTKSASGEMIVVRISSDLGETIHSIYNNHGELIGEVVQ